MGVIRLLFPILVALFLIVSDYKFSYLDKIRSAVNYAISPIYAVVNLPFQLYTWVNEQGSSKQQLLSNNQHLLSENLELKARLQETEALRLENNKLNKLLNAKHVIQDVKFNVAKVASISKSRLKKQLRIDQGRDIGIEVGQVVLGADGVVGQVILVTDGSADVAMISDPTQYVPVKNTRNALRGIAKGMALNSELLRVNFIEAGSDIKVGDVFLSSGIDGKFPDGYPLGIVSKVKQQTNNPFVSVELQPTQSLQNLEFVIIPSGAL